MDNPKISVIVPVYNVEQYLPRCIDSILAQTFTDFELLLIDDGSTDNSGKICDEYAKKKDTKIRVWHKENGGVSSARNMGLDFAKGEYIQFIDSDDFIEKNMFEIVYNTCENADIVVTDYYVNTKKQTIYKKQIISSDIITSIFESKVFGALWNKFLKRSIIANSDLRFYDELDFCEDICFLCELQQRTSRSLKVKYINQAFYHYSVTDSSLTRRSGIKQIQSWQKYINLISTILRDNPNLEYYILTNKFSVKWFSLQTNMNFSDYQNLYPDVYDTLRTEKGKKKIPIVKRFILIMSRYKLGFYLMRFILKIIKH